MSHRNMDLPDLVGSRLIVLLFIIFFYIDFIKPFSNGRNSRSWPVTQGTIVAAKLNYSFQSAKIKPYGIVYSYAIHGTTYFSSIIDTWNSNILMTGIKQPNPFTVGQSVEVFYHPTNFTRKAPFRFHQFKRETFQIDKKYYDQKVYDTTLKTGQIGNALLQLGATPILIHTLNVLIDLFLYVVFSFLGLVMLPIILPALIIIMPIVYLGRILKNRLTDNIQKENEELSVRMQLMLGGIFILIVIVTLILLFLNSGNCVEC